MYYHSDPDPSFSFPVTICGSRLRTSLSLWFIGLGYATFFLQERLGEIPGHGDIGSARSEPHLSNDTKQNAQTEQHGGH